MERFCWSFASLLSARWRGWSRYLKLYRSQIYKLSADTNATWEIRQQAGNVALPVHTIGKTCNTRVKANDNQPPPFRERERVGGEKGKRETDRQRHKERQRE